jgi:hypothetical protein
MYAQSPTGLAPEITDFDQGVHSILLADAAAREKVKDAADLVNEQEQAKGEKASVLRHKDFSLRRDAKQNLLRPEALESIFYMWRATHDPVYREWAWDVFRALVRYCRVPTGGYSGLKSVEDIGIYEHVRVFRRQSDGPGGKVYSEGQWSNWNDHQETFFLSETLKYLFLIFSEDDVLPLDEYVFNTEAHPLKRTPWLSPNETVMQQQQ